MRRILAALFLLLLEITPVLGQWRVVAPQLLGPIPYWGGSITYKNGTLWAGRKGLWHSSDLGNTWTVSIPPNSLADAILDINFFDAMNGLISVKGVGVYETVDGGVMWKQISDIHASNVRFGDSPSEIYIAENYPSSSFTAAMYESRDGGLNWSHQPISEFMPGLNVRSKGNAFAFAGTNAGSTIFATTNYGGSWQPRAGKVDWDSYTFAIDSCNADIMYVVNEDIAEPTDFISQIFVTYSGGNNWQIAAAHPGHFFCGSIALSSNAEYAQTFSDGVYRSTNFGASWATIGGPSCEGDTRLLAAVSDDTLFAADSLGNIWLTTNSGGDSIHGALRSTVLALASLQSMPDTISACDSTVDLLFAIVNGTCFPRTLLDQQLTGPDLSRFAITKPAQVFFNNGDSIGVRFTHAGFGTYHAKLHVILSDGTAADAPLDIVVLQPRNALHSSDTSLFDGDTLSECDPRAVESLRIADSSCVPRTLVGVDITGSDSAHYEIDSIGSYPVVLPNSISIRFAGGANSEYNGSIRLLFSDSTQLVVRLRGHGRDLSRQSAILPHVLFERDTEEACGPAILRSVVLRDSSCPHRTLLGARIVGSDSLSYLLLDSLPRLLTGFDTLRVQFQCDSDLSYTGKLIVRFEDGAEDTVSLLGYALHPPAITIGSANIEDDTIGGVAYVPIYIKSRTQIEGVTLVVRFDTSMLVFLGAYGVGGTRLDTVPSIVVGTERLQINADSIRPGDGLAGYVLFEIFPLDTSCTNVRFDSISYWFPNGRCTLTTDTALQSTICSTLGCGTVTLSRFLRYRQFPQLTIFPQPAKDNLLILSSLESPDATYTIVGLNGSLEMQGEINLRPLQAEALDLSHLRAGTYVLTIKGSEFRISKSIVVIR